MWDFNWGRKRRGGSGGQWPSTSMPAAPPAAATGGFGELQGLTLAGLDVGDRIGLERYGGSGRAGEGTFQGSNSRVFQLFFPPRKAAITPTSNQQRRQARRGEQGTQQGKQEGQQPQSPPKYALKMGLVLSGSAEQNPILREAGFLRRGSPRLPPHHNVVTVEHYFQEVLMGDWHKKLQDGVDMSVYSCQTWFLIMPYYSTTLQSVISNERHKKRVPPFFVLQDAARFAAQMASVVCHLQAHALAHNDIKPDNWLVDRKEGGEDTLKLTDFGCCLDLPLCRGWDPSSFSVERTDQVDLGASFFKSPELLHAAATQAGRLSFMKSDIFSVGKTLFCMLAGADAIADIQDHPTKPLLLPRLPTTRGEDAHSSAREFDSPPSSSSSLPPPAAAAAAAAVVGAAAEVGGGGRRGGGGGGGGGGREGYRQEGIGGGARQQEQLVMQQQQHGYPDELCALVERMLAPLPSERCGAKEALSHARRISTESMILRRTRKRLPPRQLVIQQQHRLANAAADAVKEETGGIGGSGGAGADGGGRGDGGPAAAPPPAVAASVTAASAETASGGTTRGRKRPREESLVGMEVKEEGGGREASGGGGGGGGGRPIAVCGLEHEDGWACRSDGRCVSARSSEVGGGGPSSGLFTERDREGEHPAAAAAAAGAVVAAAARGGGRGGGGDRKRSNHMGERGVKDGSEGKHSVSEMAPKAALGSSAVYLGPTKAAPNKSEEVGVRAAQEAATRPRAATETTAPSPPAASTAGGRAGGAGGASETVHPAAAVLPIVSRLDPTAAVGDTAATAAAEAAAGEGISLKEAEQVGAWSLSEFQLVTKMRDTFPLACVQCLFDFLDGHGWDVESAAMAFLMANEQAEERRGEEKKEEGKGRRRKRREEEAALSTSSGPCARLALACGGDSLSDASVAGIEGGDEDEHEKEKEDDGAEDREDHGGRKKVSTRQEEVDEGGNDDDAVVFIGGSANGGAIGGGGGCGGGTGGGGGREPTIIQCHRGSKLCGTGRGGGQERNDIGLGAAAAAAAAAVPAAVAVAPPPAAPAAAAAAAAGRPGAARRGVPQHQPQSHGYGPQYHQQQQQYRQQQHQQHQYHRHQGQQHHQQLQRHQQQQRQKEEQQRQRYQLQQRYNYKSHQEQQAQLQQRRREQWEEKEAQRRWREEQALLQHPPPHRSLQPPAAVSPTIAAQWSEQWRRFATNFLSS